MMDVRNSIHSIDLFNNINNNNNNNNNNNLNEIDYDYDYENLDNFSLSDKENHNGKDIDNISIENIEITNNNQLSNDIDPIEQLLMGSDYPNDTNQDTFFINNVTIKTNDDDDDDDDDDQNEDIIQDNSQFDDLTFFPNEFNLNQNFDENSFDFPNTYEIPHNNLSTTSFETLPSNYNSLHDFSSVSNIIYTNKIKEKLRKKRHSSVDIISTISNTSSLSPMSRRNSKVSKSYFDLNSSLSSSASSTPTTPIDDIQNLTLHLSKSSNSSFTSNLNSNSNLKLNSKLRSKSVGSFVLSTLNSLSMSKSNNSTQRITSPPNSRATNPFYQPPAILKRLSNSD
ncbi:hypothetical protein DAPK24_050470 [Pichia kluyveri]|uniref:Uncharacterized protein n=1 Tax=Pichia kluyveri TaxID=36015 RepID=A0AAV5RAD2_PICKL|nr:hypothetical protein DAPK24_050470 [Pichia kluyveri]